MERGNRARKETEKKQCMYFLQGRCKFGQKCYYSHEGYSQALMIRHAESEFNKMVDYFPDQQFFSEAAKSQLQFNHAYIDSHLSQEGKIHCEKALLPLDYMQKSREIDIIFVSPLNRTLETADILIKSNHLKVKKVIVLPELTEVLSKICDFCEQLTDKRNKYQLFDFTEMKRYIKEAGFGQDQHNWQDSLVDEEYAHQILVKEKNAHRYLMILKHIFPTPLESSERCFNRSLQALDIMKSIAMQEKASKILVVSHNRILKYLDGRFSKGRGRSFNNCQVRTLIF